MTANNWPARLYDVQPAERHAFGSRWVFAADRFTHGTDCLVAQYPAPHYWSGQGVDVYCEANMRSRYYTLRVLPGVGQQNTGKPGCTIEINGDNSTRVAAMLAQNIADGLVVVTP